MPSPYKIGVNVSPAAWGAVEEFFELFKTPWERAVEGRRYSVIISDSVAIAPFEADVLLVFSTTANGTSETAIELDTRTGPRVVSWPGGSMPIYGALATFGSAGAETIVTMSNRAVDRRQGKNAGGAVWQIGFDLFAEVDRLLHVGQPVECAHVPTLDQHVRLVRSLLLESGVSVIEIPARPAGFDFICCLTHDIDFFGIGRHRADRTMAGFLLRASIGIADVLRNRRTLAEALRNLRAMMSLPLVFLGWARDFWQPFEDYRQVEAGATSTFFLVPFRSRAGISPDGKQEPARAVRYQISDVAAEATEAMNHGSELAVHGLDAWRDAAAGRSEMSELTAVTGRPTAGIRMHWLYYAPDSPRHLEAAGFAYDSTWGYNETIGYRAGTSQAFRLPETKGLMELPLTIMDSALFSGGRLGLAPEAAASLWEPIVANAARDGGTVVINWHDRSLAPERLWGRAYRALLSRVARDNRVWYATAGDAVEWFRWRRAIRFEMAGDEVRVVAPATRLPNGVVSVSRSTANCVERHEQDLVTGSVSVRPAIINRQPEALFAVN